MRTNVNITDEEKATYYAFCAEHRIATDGEAGEKNGALFGNLIGVKMNSDFTQETLEVAFDQLKAQLKFVSKAQADADALARKLRPEEIEAYNAWAKNQRLLIGLDGSEEGYANVKSLLGWMRGNPVTGHNLDLALGNLINNPQVGQRIYFHPQPRQQDRSVVQGRKNHAFGQEETKPKAAAGVQQQEYVNGRKNHAWTPPEEAAKKVTAAADAWSEVIAIQLKDWVLPSQQARLENEYKAGLASGKSLRDISSSLAVIVKDRQRGR
jgi:hypothetical protein